MLTTRDGEFVKESRGRFGIVASEVGGGRMLVSNYGRVDFC